MVLFTVQCRKKIVILINKYCNLTKKGTEWHSSFVRYIFFRPEKRNRPTVLLKREDLSPE